MAKTYSDIQQQIATLQREAEKLKRQEVDGVIAKMKEAIAVYGLTAADLGLKATRQPRGAAKPSASKKGTSAKTDAAKYQDGNGNSWVGRGPRPKWLREALDAGRALEEFAA